MMKFVLYLCLVLSLTHAATQNKNTQTSAPSTKSIANSATKSAKPSIKSTSQSTKKAQPTKQNTKKPATKSTTKKTKKALPKLPAQSVLESMAKRGELQDFGERNLPYLAEKIRSQNSVKIAVFGDSHIAGDFIPRVWRAQFMQVDSIGFAYPIFPAFHQNLLTHYQHKGFEILNSRKDSYPDYPMGGIIARAKTERATIKLGLNFPKDEQDFFVQVVFKSPNKLGAFLITDANGESKRLGAKKQDTWEMSSPMRLRFPITIEALMPNAMLGGYFLHKVDSSKKATNAKKSASYVINLGINGARSDVWLKWNQELLAQELQALELDFIAISYGSNDAISTNVNEKLYKENFTKFIALLREHHPNATILIIGAPEVLTKRKDTGTYKVTAQYELVRKATKLIAKDNHTLYFDMQDFIEESGGKQKWIAQALSKPDVHLSPYGYKLVAESIAMKLQALLDKQPSTRTKKNTQNFQVESSADSSDLTAKDSSDQASSQAHMSDNAPTTESNTKQTLPSTSPAAPTPQTSPLSTSQLATPKEEQSNTQNTSQDTHKSPPHTQSTSASSTPLSSQTPAQTISPHSSAPVPNTTLTTPTLNADSIPKPPESSAAQEVWQDLEMKEF